MGITGVIVGVIFGVVMEEMKTPRIHAPVQSKNLVNDYAVFISSTFHASGSLNRSYYGNCYGSY